jgi:hypothetical protein
MMPREASGKEYNILILNDLHYVTSAWREQHWRGNLHIAAMLFRTFAIVKREAFANVFPQVVQHIILRDCNATGHIAARTVESVLLLATTFT